jgi:L-lactate dehydrogenase
MGMHDMCLSLPCVVGKDGRERVLEPPMSQAERDALLGSWKVLREAAESVGLK